MLVIRTSMITGKTREIELPVTKQQMVLWTQGLPIQTAMPQLDESQREYIMTGITPDEWDSMGWDSKEEE